MCSVNNPHLKMPTIQVCRPDREWQVVNSFLQEHSTRIRKDGNEEVTGLLYRTKHLQFVRGTAANRIKMRFGTNVVTEVTRRNHDLNNTRNKEAEVTHFSEVGVVNGLLFDLDMDYYNTPRHFEVKRDGKCRIVAQVSSHYITLVKNYTKYGQQLLYETLCNANKDPELTGDMLWDRVPVEERTVYSVPGIVLGENMSEFGGSGVSLGRGITLD